MGTVVQLRTKIELLTDLGDYKKGQCIHVLPLIARELVRKGRAKEVA